MEKKVCIVTGASGGIGSRITAKFLKEGYFVVMADIDLHRLNETIEKNGFDKECVMPLELNISDEKRVKDAIAEVDEKCSRIDCLVNTAGVCGEYNTIEKYSFEEFRKVYEVNVFGTFLMSQNVLPVMERQGFGAIVNFGSVSGMRGYSFEVGYGSSKWAVIGMTQSFANECGSKGIRCNSVSPGWVDTGMMAKTMESYKRLGIEDPYQWASWGSIARAAKPDEIADAVYFLCSDNAAFINGANIVVDGGMIIK